MKRLPDAEFEIMRIAWQNVPPITTSMIMEQLGNERDWKAQTVITLLLRLVERGFLRTEKEGKERTYYPLIAREDYLQFETGAFVEKYHQSSVANLVATLYEGNKLSDSDLDELRAWLQQQGSDEQTGYEEAGNE